MSALPNYVVATGDFIAEWMELAGVNAAELSRRLGVSRKHVSELLSGHAPLSHTLALALENVTGIPARIWNQYETTYREDLARMQSHNDLEADYERAKKFPLVYLRKFGYITASPRDKAATVQQLLSILGVASLDAWGNSWNQSSVAYRRSTIHKDNAPAIATWLSLAERGQRLSEFPAYDSLALEAALPVLKSMTLGEPTISIERAVDELRQIGVLLCFIPPVPGLKIYGATRWVSGTPIIQLSLLGKTDDQFWFTFFHEIGHVLLHGQKDLYLNGEDSRAEREADSFAADLLIPPEQAHLLPKNRSISTVKALATTWGVAPSIVLGRAQRETKDYGWGHNLKRNVELNFH